MSSQRHVLTNEYIKIAIKEYINCSLKKWPITFGMTFKRMLKNNHRVRQQVAIQKHLKA